MVGIKNEKSKFIWSETRNSNFFYILGRENEKRKFIWSETRNSNLFYILVVIRKKANLFGQKLEIQTLLYFKP